MSKYLEQDTDLKPIKTKKKRESALEYINYDDYTDEELALLEQANLGEHDYASKTRN